MALDVPAWSLDYVLSADNCNMVVNFLSILGIRDHWKNLGIYFGVRIEKLNCIEANYRLCENCFPYMIEAFLEGTSVRTWEAVINVIKRVNRAAAMKLEGLLQTKKRGLFFTIINEVAISIRFL